MSDYRWQVPEDARSALKEVLLPEGIIGVECVAAFPDPAPFASWLGTTTDAEARHLRIAQTAHARVHGVLVAACLVEQGLGGLAVVVQSHETVDRDYHGSWFNARL